MQKMSNSYRFTGLTGIIFISVLVALTPGCGRKLFPKPSGGETPPQVGDLHPQVTSQGVDISWQAPTGGSAKDIRYSILRSEMKWESRNCPDCPGISEQREIRFLDAASAENAVSPSDHKIHWLDSNTPLYHAYRYQVVVQNASGATVSLSNVATAKIYPGPAAPVSVVAAPQAQGILIQWKPVNKDVEGHDIQGDLAFQVERLVQGKGWEKVFPNGIRGNSYLDQAIASEQNYSYRVVPVLWVDNTSISGELSSVVLARAPETVLPPPPNSIWVVPAKGALEIRWTESDGKVGGYHVYRREGKEIIRLTANPIQHPPFVDHGAKRNATYFYAVSAVSAQGENKEGLLSKWAEMRNLLME
jgi:hypothetical protein